MKISIHKDSKYKYPILFAIFIFLMEQGFYFIETSAISVRGAINYDDFWLLGYLIFIALLMIRNGVSLSRINVSGAGKYFLLLIVAVLISGITSMAYLGESPIEGLRSQRWFFFIILSYFPISKAFYRHEIDYKTVEDMIVVVGALESIIYLVQYMIAGKLIFLHVSYNYNYGEIRLYVDSCAIVCMTIISMSRMMKKFQPKYLILVALGLSYEFFVSKGRLENISVIFALLVCFFFYKKNLIRKLPYFIVGIVAVIYLLPKISFLSDVFATVVSFVGGDTVSTMVYRQNLRAIFNNFMSQHPSTYIWGCGYPNVNGVGASLLNGYLLEDNGIFAFFYVYGFVGLAIVLIFFFYLLRQSIIVMKRIGDPMYLCIAVFCLISSYNIIFWWWKQDWTFIILLLICCCETRVKELKYGIKRDTN